MDTLLEQNNQSQDQALLFLSSDVCSCSLSLFLQKNGYHVSQVFSFLDVITYLDKKTPKMLLIDALQFTDAEIFDLLGLIRNFKKIHIPLLLICELDFVKHFDALEINIDNFILHPVNYDELLARISLVLQFKQFIDDKEAKLSYSHIFFAKLIHDLYNPLLANSRVLQFVKEGVYGNTLDEISGVLDSISRSNESLMKLLDTISLRSYLSSNGLDLYKIERVNLISIIESTYEQLKSLSAAKDVCLQMQLQESYHYGCEIFGDSISLWRMIFNLVFNALKFTKSGYVKLALINRENNLVLEVADSGVGIPREEIPFLFNPYWYDKVSGMRFGLHLVKSIAEAHRATVEVISEIGHGSVFSIIFTLSDSKTYGIDANLSERVLSSGSNE
ncbi:hypothetical protein WA1_50180 [Scytonema hofmannii PCC 7110]|uniref:histidine kinase n=1 Tax=Scytonema hofmannii PCC 7110 TaxID=128403 RepID=A0A139WR39_9CYAN|nr:HAMP domain-containing sensor histidine kinase [Scytonema hofmannii]KYC34896.1 hypothetical protein WA1_50180 [Scytonema hofmannii PCC 7110]